MFRRPDFVLTDDRCAGVPRSARLGADVDPERVIAGATRRSGAAVLDSAAVDPPAGRFTIIGWDPIDRIEARDPNRPNPFETLRHHLHLHHVPEAEEPLPFFGGWIGHLGYEAGGWFEEVPVSRSAQTSVPLVRLDLYDTTLVFDHVLGQWYVTGVEWGPAAGYDRPPFAVRKTEAEAWLHAAAHEAVPNRDPQTAAAPRPTLSRAAYESRVRRALDYIAAGDIYQVNFAHHFLVAWPGSGSELYQRLRRHNPASYAAYLAEGRHAILCSSPELFLHVRSREIRTRPIKGTRPRVGDEIIDAPNRTELLASAKDHAELAMIVDLERNDLGRICEFGSVRVPQPCVLEEHPTVHHLVATVTGTLRENIGPVDVLQATFPGGSITGAPKIRAMQIIDELETHQRGPYCGCIGAIGLDGTMQLNIAIRTIVLDGDTAVVPVGGGIVADSDPAGEYEETLAKAKGMLTALNTTDATVFARSAP